MKPAYPTRKRLLAVLGPTQEITSLGCLKCLGLSSEKLEEAAPGRELYGCCGTVVADMPQQHCIEVEGSTPSLRIGMEIVHNLLCSTRVIIHQPGKVYVKILERDCLF